MGSSDNPYAVLGVESDASDAVIAAAYRRLMLRWHPDRNPGSQVAEASAKAVNVAYEKLKTAHARAATNARLQREALAASIAAQRVWERRAPRRPAVPRTAFEFARMITHDMPAEDAFRVQLGAALLDLFLKS